MKNKCTTLVSRCLRIAVTTILVGIFTFVTVLNAPQTEAVAGVNQQLNFQGRLLNSQGAAVADGFYNVEFKIYQDGTGLAVGNPGGTLMWTESWLNSASNAVQVKNGYMSVQLGSVTPFGSSVDWNQDTLWLSINIGNTNVSCTPFTSCGGDGEMTPMKRLSSTPYALNSGRLGGKTSAEFLHLSQGVQEDVATNTSSIFLNKTGSGGSFLQLQQGGSDQLTLTNTGDVLFGNTSSHSVSIADSDSGTTGQNLTVSAGNAGAGGAAAAGGTLALQGGDAAGTGNANGGDIVLSGGAGTGTGASGLVVLSTPTFSTVTNDPNCYAGGAAVASSCTVAMSSVNSYAAILIGFSADGQIASLPAPTNTTAGRVLYISAADGSSDFTLEVNGGGTGNEVAMRQNSSATMVWNGTAWSAAGASSSTTLQAAYDNTLQSAGGAELVVSKTATTNGITIRDSSTNPVNGTVLSVQSSSAAALLSVNSNVTEYASNAGAEIIGSGGVATFPTSTWSGVNGATITRHATAGSFIATGQGSVAVATDTSANSGVKNTLTTSLNANTNYNVSFTARLTSGTLTDLNVYYSSDGTAASVPCTATAAVNTSVWTKINCTFAAPASSITSSNAILIRQTSGGTARTMYLDNLSVTIAADYNYATDGSVDDSINFATNWPTVGGATVSHNASVGFDASNSAQVITTGAGQGISNKLAINPLPDTLYRVTAYSASSTSGFNSFKVRYSPDGGTSFVECADYNTQTISDSLTDFTKVTCYVTTGATAVTNPYIYFTQDDATGRTFYVDAHSTTLSSNTTPNVQIGGGINGGPTTLLTLDRGASAPIASDNDALLGSMYYDTSLGRLQCYEADGWGACGSSPDSVITISPEYNNAVLHGTGIGTMVSDICSDTLDINDGSSGQPTICGTNETFNFYKWTSPQASAQTYSIYVTYQLPGNFKSFASGKTSITGRTDSSSAEVEYQVYKNDLVSGMTPCGSAVTVSSGLVSTWQTGTASGTADPSTCNFTPGNSIVFKINATASQNASAFIGNLNFTFNNQ